MKHDVLVSVRLPRQLIEELKVILYKEHFMTLSEALRSIIREKYLAHQNSNQELKKIQDSLKENDNAK